VEDLGIDSAGGVATVEIRRPPHNFFDEDLIAALADALEALDEDAACRAVVLAAQGSAFCAGARLEGGGEGAGDFRGRSRRLYDHALRLFRTRKPLVAAVHGAAVGGGLGLALAADLRVTCPEARFSANFARLGFHPGFGLSLTLPELVGPSRAADLLLTGRRVPGEEAAALGLADRLVPRERVREEATALARELAGSAPLAVVAIRATLRRGLAERVAAALEHELAEQARLIATPDAREGILAMAERREPRFTGRG